VSRETTITAEQSSKAGKALRRVPADAIHRLSEWQAILGLPLHTLGREARLGRLRVAKRAGTTWATGSWIREWLEAGEVRRAPRAPPEGHA
jgi:hypothetical protein